MHQSTRVPTNENGVGKYETFGVIFKHCDDLSIYGKFSDLS